VEREILPARVPGYVPRLLDELGAAGEVCWVGQGSLGRDDGRLALYRPDRLALLLPDAAPDGDATPVGPGADGWLQSALLAHLDRRGASFYRDLVAAVAAAARESGESAPGQREVLDALWALVWAGLVTTDTFAPLRALRWGRRGSRTDRPRPGVARAGPPEAAGRWSLVRDARQSAAALTGRDPSPTERRHALATRLLERQGIVTRDGVAGEGIAGGFGAVYPILRELEERGRVRRGYFVEGLGGAQFALPGAVDRLRAARGAADAGEVARAVVLAMTDPANPWGAALPWPRRDDADRRPLPRAAGASVVLVDGSPALVLERGGRSLVTLPATDDADTLRVALDALVADVAVGRRTALEIQRVDGAPTASSPIAEQLGAVGFRSSYRGFVLRSTSAR
jgi:ATP-dependent Lhr-like helicase